MSGKLDAELNLGPGATAVSIGPLSSATIQSQTGQTLAAHTVHGVIPDDGQDYRAHSRFLGHSMPAPAREAIGKRVKAASAKKRRAKP